MCLEHQAMLWRIPYIHSIFSFSRMSRNACLFDAVPYRTRISLSSYGKERLDKRSFPNYNVQYTSRDVYARRSDAVQTTAHAVCTALFSSEALWQRVLYGGRCDMEIRQLKKKPMRAENSPRVIKQTVIMISAPAKAAFRCAIRPLHLPRNGHLTLWFVVNTRTGTSGGAAFWKCCGLQGRREWSAL